MNPGLLPAKHVLSLLSYVSAYIYFCVFFFFFFLGHTWECSGPIPGFVLREPYGLLGIDYGQGKCSTRYTNLGQSSINILGFLNGVKELELPGVKMV